MAFVYWKKIGRNRLIAEVTLNRPEVKNAFHTEMAKELLQVCNEVKESETRVVLFTSSSKVFCAGADLKERNQLSEQEWINQHHLFREVFLTIQQMKQPTIAVVDGYALAGGFELALNCDMIVASHDAVFGLPEVKRGIMPGCGGTRLLAKRIGVSKAKEWTCTGRMVLAEEADKAGLLNRLVSTNELHKSAIEIAETIAANAPLAVQNCKASIDACYVLENEDAIKTEISLYNSLLHTEDRMEGVQAFVEKREPIFKGR